MTHAGQTVSSVKSLERDVRYVRVEGTDIHKTMLGAHVHLALTTNVGVSVVGTERESVTFVKIPTD